MPDLSLADVSLHYEVDGQGPPLLLLAGMLSDSASWAGLLPQLASHFTVIRPDNRSTGRTTPWHAEATLQHYARDAAPLMAYLGHAEFNVAGHSMGGLVGMELTAIARVRTLAILASAPVCAPRTMAVFDALRDIRRAPGGEQLWLRALYPWVFGPVFFTDPENVETALGAAMAYPHAQSADAMAYQIEVLREYRPTVRATEIKCDTLVLHAAEDILIPRAEAEKAFAAIPGVKQIIVPDAGHSIHWDAADAVAAHIAHFAAGGVS